MSSPRGSGGSPRARARRWSGLAWLLLSAGCAAPPAAEPAPEPEPSPAAWRGELRTWGTLREVLRRGHTQGRVSGEAAAERPHSYGIGALEGLSGELLVLDGALWIGEVVEGRGQAFRAVAPAEHRAAFLALAEVQEWHEVVVRERVGPEQLEAFVAAEAERLGLDPSRPFPLLVLGAFAQLELHVLNGACPIADPVPPGSPQAPFRLSLPAAEGTIVGVFARGAAGQLTHHGRRTHLHVLVEGPEPQVGHVDAVALEPGALLRLPRR